MQKTMIKKDNAFRTISEVADHLKVEQHVLRFWETKFIQIKPMKRGGGRRYYRPEDVIVLERIHTLLYKEGYTIKGAQNVLKGSTRNKIAESAPKAQRTEKDKQVALTTKQIALVKQTLNKLKAIRTNLEKVA
jgi:DNA-binding transcriptional MerR regulator